MYNIHKYDKKGGAPMDLLDIAIVRSLLNTRSISQTS